MALGLYVKRIAFGAFATASWYSAARQTRPSNDHILQSVIIALVISGLTLLLADRFASRDVRGTEKSTADILGWWPLISQKRRRRGFFLIVGFVLLRVVILLQTFGERGCSRRSLEAMLLPMLIAVSDSFGSYKVLSTAEEVESMSYSIFQEIYFSLSLSRFRYLLPTALLSSGIFLLGRNTASSTYICPIIGNRDYKIGLAQISTVFLDVTIIIGIWRLLRNNEPYNPRLKIVGALCVCSAAAITAVGIILLFFNLGSEEWTPILNISGIWPGLRNGVALAMALLCVIHLAPELQPVHLVVLFIFTCMLKSVVQTAWASTATFPPQSKSLKSFGLLILILAFITFMRTYVVSEAPKVSHKKVRRISSIVYLILVVTLVVIESLYLTRSALIRSHPINSLAYKARIEGDRWRVQASSSISLSTAVQEYQIRHGGWSPPPNFDKWYSFAMAHHCPVIDDYNQIFNDLLGFWDIQPQEIKRRTMQQLLNDDVAVVLIRDGRVDPASDVNLDETWPLNETIATIKKFSQWLPDMDIAIRISDDSRRAIPWDLIEQSKSGDFHGFLTMPALEPQTAWKSERGSLIPVFSRSKSPGYNDILLPGPNDFIDFTKPGARDWVDVNQPRPNTKVFSEMEDILFWRGPANEGESREWQGMLQQRLVHFANNLSSTDLVPVLLPSTEEDKFRWENVPARELAGLFRMDIGFTKFKQCSPRHCKEQEEEFGTKIDIPLEKLWDYRYLLDLDARGTSQKFISLLHSNSLPFRISTSRSWFDERLIPFLHYIPQSPRLHDVYSTLAYFAGLNGRLNGRDINMRPQFREAQFIADQGWKWAEKALRREDAEAYLFRLLLEWGRVTNDRRDEIGFQLDV